MINENEIKKAEKVLKRIDSLFFVTYSDKIIYFFIFLIISFTIFLQ